MFKNNKTKIKILFWIIITFSILTIVVIKIYYTLELDRVLSPSDYFINQKTIKIKKDPNNPWPYLDRATEYFKIYNYDKALEDCNSIIKLNDKFKFVYSLKAKVHIIKGNSTDALNSINTLARLETFNLDIYFIKGLIYDSQNETLKAIKEYSDYIKAKRMADFPNTYFYVFKRRAVNNFKNMYYEKALSDIEEALTYKKDDKELINFKDSIKKIISKEIKKDNSIEIPKLNIDEAIHIEW